MAQPETVAQNRLSRRLVPRVATRSLMPYAFVLPAFAIYAAFLLWPLGRVVEMSLWNWDGLSPTHTWIGFQNYAQAVSDPQFASAVLHNAEWVAMAAAPILGGLALAVILDYAKPRGWIIYRTIFFMPYMMPLVVTAIIWQWMYDPNWGVLNSVLRAIGLTHWQQDWLGDPHIALVALAMAANWTGYGFCMMLFLAGLASMDRTPLEAARVDGANSWQQFWYVTLPELSNTLNVVVLIVFIATVRVFDYVFVTTAGGPAGATDVLGTLIYRNTFQNQNVGYGAALAVITGAIILVGSLVYLIRRERSE